MTGELTPSNPEGYRLTIKKIIDDPEKLTLYRIHLKEIETDQNYEMTAPQKDQYARFMMLVDILYRELLSNEDQFVSTQTVKKGEYSYSNKIVGPATKLLDLVIKMEQQVSVILKDARKTKNPDDSENSDALNKLLAIASKMDNLGKDTELSLKTTHQKQPMDVEAHDIS